MQKKEKTKKTLGPVFVIMLIGLIIAFASLILSLIGFGGQVTVINNGALESSMVTVNNIFSKQGLNYLFGNVISILNNFEPLALTIIALIGIGIGEKSGLFKGMFQNVKYMHPRTVTFITLLVSIIARFFGDFAFVFRLLERIFLPLHQRNQKSLIHILK